MLIGDKLEILSNSLYKAIRPEESRAELYSFCWIEVSRDEKQSLHYLTKHANAIQTNYSLSSIRESSDEIQFFSPPSWERLTSASCISGPEKVASAFIERFELYVAFTE